MSLVLMHLKYIENYKNRGYKYLKNLIYLKAFPVKSFLNLFVCWYKVMWYITLHNFVYVCTV